LAAPVLVLVLVLAPHVLVLVLVLEKKVLATALLNNRIGLGHIEELPNRGT
jgi:hypothetical protein